MFDAKPASIWAKQFFKCKKEDGSSLMNNNRQPNNNRRRGRNNSRQQNNNRNGFDYQNNIDNRARGNASQMLEKYKKLAADALHNDDRVNAEYYHQFADHYFRVLADFRIRQEAKQDDRRPQRDDNRNNSDNDADAGNDAMDYQSSEQSDDFNAPNEAYEEEQPQRRARQPRGAKPMGRNRNDSGSGNNDSQVGIDLAVLPPAISVSSDAVADAKPVRKPRAPRRPKSDQSAEVATAAE
jgi:Domain of unknown function (DUF4167)